MIKRFIPGLMGFLIMVSSSSAMSSPYLEGLQKEIYNRTFARHACLTMVKQKGLPEARQTLWREYLRLELFTWPIYQRQGEELGLNIKERSRDRLKGKALHLVPNFLYDSLTEASLKNTIAYVDFLKDVQAAAPAADKEFMQFVVKQEELQVFIMTQGLKGDAAAIVDAVIAFLSRWQHLSPD